MVIRRRSTLHNIIIRDRAGTRTLQFGNTIQSTMRLDDPLDGGLEYVDFFHVAVLLRPSIRRTLFIGLGGASGPKQFLHAYPKMQIDVVEIDPEVIRVAHELFGLESSPRCAIHEDEGRRFLERTGREWDLIIVDAYTTRRSELVAPRTLTSPDFFDLCSERTPRDGLVVFNCAAAADGRLSRQMHRSMSQVFPALLAFESSTAENTVLIGSHAPLEQRSTRLVEMVRGSGEPSLSSRRSLVRRCRQIHRPMSENR
jgi:spermidine synthase